MATIKLCGAVLDVLVKEFDFTLPNPTFKTTSITVLYSIKLSNQEKERNFKTVS